MSNTYEVRWRNGAWKLFNLNEYKEVAIFMTQREAEDALKRTKK